MKSADLSVIATCLFGLLLALLHGLKPELEPSWRFISEYALGDHGWMMTLAFFLWAFACVSLIVALWPVVSGWIGRTGLALLGVNAVGLIMAGAFRTDPLTLSHDQATTTGMIHSFGGLLGMAMPFAVGAIAWWAIRRRPSNAWRTALLIASVAALIGFIYAFVTLGLLISGSSGRFGPDVPVGWPNRVEVAGYWVWLLVAGLSVRGAKGPPAPAA